MLMKHILCGRRQTHLILLRDNLNFNSSSVINAFIEESKHQPKKVHFLSTEINRTYNWLNQNVVIHKYFPDPWEILKGREAELSFTQIVDGILQERKLHENTSILFVIDSVASLLQYVDTHELCEALKSLVGTRKESSAGVQVLCVCSSELMPDDCIVYKNLKYLASTVITLISEAGRSPQLALEYYQNNGKILKETYLCKYGGGRKLELEILKEEPVKKIEDEVSEKLINTTFKLTLEEKEKKSRSQVILPYMKTSNTGVAGRIFYEPDVNDDWDDEDPDDDLEI